MSRAHPRAEVIRTLAALTEALGAPSDYSDEHDTWTWGTTDGHYLDRGVELRASYAGEMIVVVQWNPAHRISFAIDETEAPVQNISTIESDTRNWTRREAPIASVVEAAKSTR